MKEFPLVHIILVNYKSVDHTIECIQSLQNISYRNYKIVVVDNCSQNDSVEELQKYDDIILIKNEFNSGFAGGNNLAIKYSIKENADYVLLLNNDTVVEPDFLEKLIENVSPSIGISIGKILFYSDRSMVWYAGGEINKFKGSTDVNGFELDKGQYEEKKYVTFASGCCMLISKEIIEKVGVLKEDYFLYFEDTDYCERVIKAGYKILYNSKSIIYHKVSTSTVKDSYTYLYYFTRNRLYFIKDNLNGINKIISYIYSFIFIFIKSIIRKQEKKPIILAVKHFFHDIKGKLNDK